MFVVPQSIGVDSGCLGADRSHPGASMRIHVDEDRCQGHTLCNMTAPEIFDLRDEDGHAVVRVHVVTTELQDKARMAAAGCPEQAIVIES